MAGGLKVMMEQTGWAIGTETDYENEEEQDKADSNSIYHILENQIIPTYYNQDRNGISRDWIKLMKNSIKTTGGKYSMARQVVDYVDKFYIPLSNLNSKYFNDLSNVIEYENWKKDLKKKWESIKIDQPDNIDNARMVAGSKIKAKCFVDLAGISEENANVQIYFGQFLENGSVKNVYTVEMKKTGEENGMLVYEGIIELPTGGNFGYTFRVMPKHKMLLDPENMNLIKWLVK